MSSYNPPEESEDGSSFDPGVKGKEITEQRDFSEFLAGLDHHDYVLFGLVLSIPAAILAGFFLAILFPEYQETVGRVVRRIGETVVDLLATHLAMVDVGAVFPVL